MSVNKLQLPAKDNAVQLKINEIIDNLGGGGATDVQINSTSITNQGVANIVTNSAYDASSNKIATMSDLPDNELFVATYNTTTYNEVLTAYNAGKIIFVVNNTTKRTYGLNYFTGSPTNSFKFSSYENGNQYICTISETDGWVQSSITLEETSNKVTSISSSSTNTQYPSAKLLYDQLALKQNISTAVTHTANTQVGSSSIPVYINSSGVATSTGLSIASSRFDGQWVLSYHSSLVTATSAGSSQASISSYLPSDSYDYEVMFYLVTNYNSTAGDVAIGNTASPLSNNCIRIRGRVRNTSASVHCTGIIPIKSSARIIYTQREVNVAAFQVDMIAYRRIGTNT